MDELIDDHLFEKSLEENKIGLGGVSFSSNSDITKNIQQIDTENKSKSIKPKPKLMMKTIDNKLITDRIKNPKDTILKSKLAKGFQSKDIDSSHGNKSIETFANTDDDKNDFEHLHTESKENLNTDSNLKTPIQKSSLGINQSLGKMKSRLSLKSRVYVKSHVPNLDEKYNTLFDSHNRYSENIHRNSFPQKPLEFNNRLPSYSQSMNYTMHSSDGKASIQYPLISPRMGMERFMPMPLQKFHSNSHDTFHTVDNAYYMHMPRQNINSQNNILSNTTPLPDMSSFNRVSYSPDFNLQQPYYNVNMASTGNFSNDSSDFIQNMQPHMQYYNPSLGSTWPKIPQMEQSETPKYSTIPVKQNSKSHKKVSVKEKTKFELKLENIINGADPRTTLMIRNIPNKYTQAMLKNELDLNHKGLYDAIYLPIDPKNQCNCGYAFVNVIHPVIILSMFMEFNGKSWKNFNSEKICELAYGRLQGQDQLLSQLDGSGVMQQSDPSKKPLLLDAVVPTQELVDRVIEDFKSSYGFP